MCCCIDREPIVWQRQPGVLKAADVLSLLRLPPGQQGPCLEIASSNSPDPAGLGRMPHELCITCCTTVQASVILSESLPSSFLLRQAC